jgi:hypothetical protein
MACNVADSVSVALIYFSAIHTTIIVQWYVLCGIHITERAINRVIQMPY